MKHYQKKYTQTVTHLLWLALVISLVLPISSKAATVTTPLDLATIPLANSPTIKIQPNLLFVLDDSGSMDWAYMPDWANTSDASLFRNASYNTVAYNPAIRYTPPAYFDAGGLNVTQYPSQIGVSTATGAGTGGTPNWKNVKNNAYTSTATSDLSNNAFFYSIVPGEYCTQPDLKVCVAQAAPSSTHPFPAPVRWCTTNAIAISAATPAANTCQATRITSGTTFNNLRVPTARISTITVSNDTSSGSVAGITVSGAQILSGLTTANTDSNTVASRIAQNINACTYATTGNCTVSGFFATVSGRVVTLYASPSAADANIIVTPLISETSAKSFTSTAFSKNAVPGSNVPRVISAATTSYALPGTSTKAAARSDCAGPTCTYSEEMTNYANWWAYYQTRTQTMKTSASFAFKDVGEDFRVGFMTTSTLAARMLKFDTFNTAHKAAWYNKFFSTPADRNTPLRGALSKAGRIYANESTAKRGVFTDPVEYECQQNFTLLTTDGFWNTGDETSTYAGGPNAVDGITAVGNLDSAALGTPRPLREGTTAVPNTLADVAKYYHDTDLRTSALGNCTGALGNNVCQSPAPSTANQKQNMVTMTLGMGVDGTLTYTSDYKTANSGDFSDIKNGTKNWPDPIANTQEARIDDLWHAAVNGGGSYFSAKNPTELAKSLKQALASIEVKIGAGAAAGTSTLNPTITDNSSYMPSYTSGHWTGNLERRIINATTGTVGLTAVNCVEDVVTSASCTSPSSIVSDGGGSYNCVTPGATSATCLSPGVLVGTDCKVPVAASCSGTLKAMVSALTDVRTIKMNVGGALADFNAANVSAAGLNGTFNSAWLAANLTQWISLSPAQQANATPNNLINYLRGQTGYDENSADPNKKVFRTRQATLGDVVDSKPAFLGKPNFSYTDPGYASFKAAQAGRAKVVYLGANDGMLHAFDADTLTELWAYVPTMVIPNMWKLADTAYANKHSYYVNGDPIVSDICVSACTSASAAWKTILVAGLNGGGRGYYALDITNPTAPQLLWEFNANNEPNLGYTFGAPVITKKPDGTWVVLVTSGYNNISDNSPFYALSGTKFKPNNPPLYTTGNGEGYLYILDAVSGSKLDQIATGTGNTATPSGLAKIRNHIDGDAKKNNTTTYVYGGDLLGNLWRFNIVSNSVIKFAALEASGIKQPITTRPELGLINNKRVVFVGTGKYLEVSDLTDYSQQTLYAIKDDSASTTLVNPRSVLVPQTIVPSGADNRKSGSSNVVNFSTGLGWYVDFPDAGERQNVASQLSLGTLAVPTIVPTSSACQPAGYGWSNYLDYTTGLSVVPATGILSTRTTSPIVGQVVIYVDGKPILVISTADGKIVSLPLPIKGSGKGFQTKRSIWRELVN
ncbi:MAG: PilC/PilY family type IV pilus protein [Methylotenera sp.]|nr:PilC/PilY family type IV pilus protein [Methylotenera sp.]